MTSQTPEKQPLPAQIKTAIDQLTSPEAKADAFMLLATKHLLEETDVRAAMISFLDQQHKQDHATWLAERTGYRQMLLEVLVTRNTSLAEIITIAQRWGQYDYVIELQKKAGRFREAGDTHLSLKQWREALECYLQADDAFFEVAECLTHVPKDFEITDAHKQALLKAAKTKGDIKLRAKYARLGEDRALLRQIYLEDIQNNTDYFELEKIFLQVEVDFPEERIIFGKMILKRIANPRYAKVLADKLGFTKLSKQYAKKAYNDMKKARSRRSTQDTSTGSEGGKLAEDADEFADALKYYEQSKLYQDAIRMAVVLKNDSEVTRLVAKVLAAYRSHPIHHERLAEALVAAKSPLAQHWLVKAMEYAEHTGNLEKAANFARLAGDARAEVYGVIFAAAKLTPKS